MKKGSILLAFACGAVIFSIDEKRASNTDGYCGIKKILLPAHFDTPYQAAQKIKAMLKIGTHAHVFCHSIPALLIRVLQFVNLIKIIF